MTVSGSPSSWLTWSTESRLTLFVSLAFSRGAWPKISRICKKIMAYNKYLRKFISSVFHPARIILIVGAELALEWWSFSKPVPASLAIIHCANTRGLSRNFLHLHLAKAKELSRIIMQHFPVRRPFIILKDRGKGVFNFSEMGLSFCLYCAGKKWPRRGMNSSVHWFWGTRCQVSGVRKPRC